MFRYVHWGKLRNFPKKVKYSWTAKRAVDTHPNIYCSPWWVLEFASFSLLYFLIYKIFFCIQLLTVNWHVLYCSGRTTERDEMLLSASHEWVVHTMPGILTLEVFDSEACSVSWLHSGPQWCVLMLYCIHSLLYLWNVTCFIIFQETHRWVSSLNRCTNWDPIRIPFCRQCRQN